MNNKIIQIIPANGWQAVYENGSRWPLIGWALIDRKNDTIVEGLISVGGVIFASDLDGFTDYETGWRSELPGGVDPAALERGFIDTLKDQLADLDIDL